MLHPRAEGWDTVRSLFLIDPRDHVRFMLAYPPSTGRSFEEVLRVIDSLRRADEHGVSTPAGWRRGDDVLIPIEVSSEEARDRFPRGFEVTRPYLRTTPDPESGARNGRVWPADPRHRPGRRGAQYHQRNPATKLASLTARPSRRAMSAVSPKRRVQEMPT